MSKLVDIVLDNGGEPTECMRALVMTEQTLIDTIEQVCAPLVAALNCFDNDITYENGNVIRGLYWQDVQFARQALRNLNSIIGDKS